MKEGWIKMYRKIEDNPIVCKDNDYFRVWHHLLYNASHQSQYVVFNNEKIEIKPGQYITGRKQISEECNISESKTERILKWFENDHQIEQQTSTKGRLITIVNWEKYQNIEQQSGQRVGNTQTIIKQRTVTNKNDNNVINNISSINLIKEEPNIFTFFENEFGQTISSTALSKLSEYQKEFDDELIKQAIRECVYANVRTINYLDGILNNWRGQGIKTYSQWQLKNKNREKNKQPKVEVFDYDWLNEEEE